MARPATSEGAERGAIGRTREFLEMIKFEHTIFALPFAYMTLFLVESGWPRASVFAWVTLAMVAGRTFGMAANRLIDAGIDARNPRTRDRALPAGRITVAEVGAFMAVSLALFLAAVYRLSPWAGRLWPIVIAVMVFYPYTKRFTWMSHLALGLVYVMVPAAVWIAVANTLPREAVLLGLGAGFWVAGFDIIYACQDIEIDRREGLHSMPADMGVGAALWTARVFHLLFVAALVLAGIGLGTGVLYYAGLAVAAILLVYEHRLVTPQDLSKIDVAFFTTNGVVSIVLFVLAAADTIVGRA
jgi:4-hydroxybenzoate polyprenyltransferase